MKLTNVRRGAGRPILAWFDVDFDHGIRVYNVELRRNGAGALRVFAPSAGERRIVTFSPETSDRIIKLAEAHLKGPMPHGATSQSV